MTDASDAAPSAHALTVLIVDDEALARERLRELLDRESVATILEAEDGTEAVSRIREAEPDLVFLDVQMPGMTGIDVIEEVGLDDMPVTVFVTAYDQYAIKAFDLAAVDYLLKPFDDERFEAAFERALKRLDDQELRQTSRHLMELLNRSDGNDPEELEALAAPSDPDDAAQDDEYLERIAVQGRGRVQIVDVSEVDYITADGSYVELHTGGETHLVRERMKTLEERLDPSDFVRIHRSTIVRLDEVKTVLRGGGGNYAVRLTDGTRLSLSRSRVETLQDRLGVDVTTSRDR
jgi:two-component system LytT family response regulator